MTGLSRGDISFTDMPGLFQSGISACTCFSTASGKVAGPALKLNILDMLILSK